MVFKPGQSGNPGGAPKEKPFRDALRKALYEADGDVRRLDRIARRLIVKAEQGDLVAIKECMDRLDGRVPQSIAGDNEHDPITMVVTGVPRAYDSEVDQGEYERHREAVMRASITDATRTLAGIVPPDDELPN